VSPVQIARELKTQRATNDEKTLPTSFRYPPLPSGKRPRIHNRLSAANFRHFDFHFPPKSQKREARPPLCPPAPVPRLYPHWTFDSPFPSASGASLREAHPKSTTNCQRPTYAKPTARFPLKNQKREASSRPPTLDSGLWTLHCRSLRRIRSLKQETCNMKRPSYRSRAGRPPATARQTLPPGGDSAGRWAHPSRRIFATTGTASRYGNVCAIGDVSDWLKIIYVGSRGLNGWVDRAGVAGRYGWLHWSVVLSVR
jgi:hypothetical protein